MVRIGPLGPYANGWGRAWPLTAYWGVALVLVAGVPNRFVHRRTFRSGREAGGVLLAAPGSLVVTGERMHAPDGSTHVIVRNPWKAPPHRRLDLPGRTPRHGQWAGVPRRRLASWQTLLDVGKRPLLHLEHRSDLKHEPETVLHDPSGVPRLLIRREGGAWFRVLDPGGAEIGFARPDGPDARAGLELLDAAGTPVARAARRGPEESVLRVETHAPVALRSAAFALALLQMRTVY